MIKIKPSYKYRTPHRPTKVHRSKKRYSRRGKKKDRLRREIISQLEENL